MNINFPRDSGDCGDDDDNVHVTRARTKWTENIPINYAVIVCALARNYTYVTRRGSRGRQCVRLMKCEVFDKTTTMGIARPLHINAHCTCII